MKNRRGWVVVLVLLAGVAGCRGFEASAPEGFAAFDGYWQFKAVSSDGVLYRVRAVRHEPEADLAFWKEAFKKRMLEAGYNFLAESEVQVGGEKAYQLELAAPVGQMDYAYTVTLLVRKGKLVLAEAAGEVTSFAKHREALAAAVQKIR